MGIRWSWSSVVLSLLVMRLHTPVILFSVWKAPPPPSLVSFPCLLCLHSGCATVLSRSCTMVRHLLNTGNEQLPSNESFDATLCGHCWRVRQTVARVTTGGDGGPRALLTTCLAWEQWAHTNVYLLFCLEDKLHLEVFISLTRLFGPHNRLFWNGQRGYSR